MDELARALSDIAFEIGQARLPSVGFLRSSASLTAYDAAYVALAEERGLPLVTDDESSRYSRPLVAGLSSG